MMCWSWHVITRTGAVVKVVHVVEKPIGVQFIADLSPVGMTDMVAVAWHGLILILTAMMAVTMSMDLGW